MGDLPDGRVVFVPRTAPGDRARVSLTREKKRWARGVLAELLEASPQRRDPACPLFDKCGGCALQHLAYDQQLLWKGRMVGDALRRIGDRQVADPNVEAASDEYRYRNKLSLTLRRVKGGRVVAGFHALGAPGKVLDVHGECLLPLEPLRALWVRLRQEWGPAASLLPEGRELRLTIRVAGEEGTLLVQGGTGDGQPQVLLEAVPGLESIWREDPDGTVRNLAGSSTVALSWLGETVEVAGGAFLQVNPEAGQLLHRFVIGLARELDPGTVVEGYCGIGTLGRALAREGREVVGIEMDPLAVEGARRGAPPTFHGVEGRVESVIGQYLPSDLVIVNPPRTGLGEGVAEALRTGGFSGMIYVSCDPATLGRDLQRVGSGYRIRDLRSFDLFPQTSHVETVAVLVPSVNG